MFNPEELIRWDRNVLAAREAESKIIGSFLVSTIEDISDVDKFDHDVIGASALDIVQTAFLLADHADRQCVVAFLNAVRTAVAQREDE